MKTELFLGFSFGLQTLDRLSDTFRKTTITKEKTTKKKSNKKMKEM